MIRRGVCTQRIRVVSNEYSINCWFCLSCGKIVRFLCYDVDAERSREMCLPTGRKKWRSCRRSESDSGSYSGPRSLRAGVLFHVKQTKAGRWGNAVAAKICRRATLRQKKFEQKELKGNAVSGNHQNIQS